MSTASRGLIVGKDTSNPVLLYLHGGLPDYFLSKQYPTGVEDLFTVVWWEQRGAGLSYSPDIPKESLTTEQSIADTLAVADYLRHRFGQERIYLMAHSGGTFRHPGCRSAPERFRAYIGVAQMTNQLRSELLAYEFMLERFRQMGDLDMVRKLEAAPVTLDGGTPPAYLAVRDEAMHRSGVGTMHTMTSVMQGLFLASLQTREYTLGEKVGLWRGKLAAGVSARWEEQLSTDLFETLRPSTCPCTSSTADTITPSLTRWHRRITNNCARRSKGSIPSSSPRTARCSKSRTGQCGSWVRMCWPGPPDLAITSE